MQNKTVSFNSQILDLELFQCQSWGLGWKRHGLTTTTSFRIKTLRQKQGGKKEKKTHETKLKLTL